MSNQQILEKAIQKAIDGGWKDPHGNTLRVDEGGRLFCFVDGATDGVQMYGYQFNLEQLIFNHDFAKALWGDHFSLIEVRSLKETEHVSGMSQIYNLKNYEWHLMQMVVAPDPIKYLGENI